MTDIDTQLREAHAVVQEVIDEEMRSLGSKSPKGLYEPMEYILRLGGKRLRPLLAYLSYKVVKPTGTTREIAPLMKAVEVFHNFSLLHDDLMDDAPVRRGKPTVYYQWGSNTAILSGDGMLIEAYRALEEVSPELVARLLPLFNTMALGVCEGQQYDMEFEQRKIGDVSMREYLDMISLKTSYLFRGSMTMGAVLAGATDADTEHLAIAADKMGLAFQIMDDYLDVFADPEFGKRRGGDIIEGKQTWLLLTAVDRAKSQLIEALSIEDEEMRIDAVQRVYEHHAIHTDALVEVRRLTEEAVTELRALSMPSDVLQELFYSLTARVI